MAAIAPGNQLEKASDTANGRAESSLQRVNEVVALAKSTTVDIEAPIKGVGDTANANLESAKMIGELERQSEEIGKIVHLDADTVEQFRMGFLIEVLVLQERNLTPVHRELDDVVVNLADNLARGEDEDSQQGGKGFFG